MMTTFNVCHCNCYWVIHSRFISLFDFSGVNKRSGQGWRQRRMYRGDEAPTDGNSDVTKVFLLQNQPLPETKASQSHGPRTVWCWQIRSVSSENFQSFKLYFKGWNILPTKESKSYDFRLSSVTTHTPLVSFCKLVFLTMIQTLQFQIAKFGPNLARHEKIKLEFSLRNYCFSSSIKSSICLWKQTTLKPFLKVTRDSGSFSCVFRLGKMR